MGRDRSLDALLGLDGLTLVIDDEGHVVRFVVRQDASDRGAAPWAVVHAVERPGGKFMEQPRVHDHVHRGKDDEGRPYEFVDAGKLIADFWTEVDRMLGLDEE